KTLLAMTVAGGYGASVGWKRLIEQGALGRLVQFVDLAPHRLHLRSNAGWTRPLALPRASAPRGLRVGLSHHGRRFDGVPRAFMADSRCGALPRTRCDLHYRYAG